MRKADLPFQADLRTPPSPHGGGRPLADPVYSEEGGLVERRAKERARRVREVVLREQELRPRHAQSLLDEGADPQLVEEPRHHGLPEQPGRPRKHLQRRHQDALELHEGLLEERHVVELRTADTLGGQHGLDRLHGELVVVLLARETLLLGRAHHHAILHQRRRGVVKETRDSQHVHG